MNVAELIERLEREDRHKQVLVYVENYPNDPTLVSYVASPVSVINEGSHVEINLESP